MRRDSEGRRRQTWRLCATARACAVDAVKCRRERRSGGRRRIRVRHRAVPLCVPQRGCDAARCNAATPCRGLRQTARRGMSDAIAYRIPAHSFADIRTHAYVFVVTHHIMVTPVPAVDESEVKMTVMLRSRE